MHTISNQKTESSLHYFSFSRSKKRETSVALMSVPVQTAYIFKLMPGFEPSSIRLWCFSLSLPEFMLQWIVLCDQVQHLMMIQLMCVSALKATHLPHSLLLCAQVRIKNLVQQFSYSMGNIALVCRILKLLTCSSQIIAIRYLLGV